MAEYGCWTCNVEVPSSSPLSDHLDLFHSSSVFKSSATLVNSQLVSIPPVGVLKMFMFHFSCYFQRFIVSPISTAVLNTLKLKVVLRSKNLLFFLQISKLCLLNTPQAKSLNFEKKTVYLSCNGYSDVIHSRTVGHSV